MARSKNHQPELEHLRQELRTAKAQIKHLKKELARANKNVHRLNDLEDIARDEGLRDLIETENAEVVNKCLTCGGEQIKLPNSKIRVIHQADCPERKKK